MGCIVDLFEGNVLEMEGDYCSVDLGVLGGVYADEFGAL